MDVTDMTLIDDFVFSTGFKVFDQVILFLLTPAGRGRPDHPHGGGVRGPPLPPHVGPADRLLRQQAGRQVT